MFRFVSHVSSCRQLLCPATCLLTLTMAPVNSSLDLLFDPALIPDNIKQALGSDLEVSHVELGPS